MMKMELLGTQSTLAESPMITDGSKPLLERPGIYKRKVFIQGATFYSRWEEGRWYECFPCSDDPRQDLHSFSRAALTTMPSDFQQSMAWWGLAEEFKP